ncbi:MAG: hypothetical protein AAF597_15920, partial [Bacteroidota bacterium]
ASREGNDAQGVFRQTQRFVFGLSAVILGGLALGGNAVATGLGYPDQVIYVYLVLLTVAFDVWSAVPLARLRLQQRPWRFVAANLGNVLVNLFLIFLLLYWWPAKKQLLGFTYDERDAVVYYLMTIALAAAFRFVFLIVEGWVARPRNKAEALDAPREGVVPPLQEMVWYSLPLTLVAAAGIINALVGPTVIRWFFGPNQEVNDLAAGQFNAALKLAVFLNLAITAYNYAAEPYFFRQAGNDPAKADKRIYADALRAYGIVAALACAGILLFLPWLKFFIGDASLREGLFVLPIMLGANVCFGIYSNLSVAYKLTDKTFLGGGIALVGSVVVIAVSTLLIGTIGLYAPALAMLGCYALMCVLVYAVSRKYFPVNYPLARLAAYAVLAIVAVVVGQWLLSGENVASLGTFDKLSGAADAGAMVGRGAVFVALCAAIAALEWSWIRRTFLT